MPDLTGLPALDVVIGLAFVYFVFSVLASGINEAVAGVCALRARSLERGLRRMLTTDTADDSCDAVAKLAKHPMIRGFVKKPKSKLPWSRRFPSYLPARTFGLAFLDTLAKPTGVDDSKDVLGRLRARIEADGDKPETAFGGLPSDIQDLLKTLVVDAQGNVDTFRKSVEDWFDDTMKRVSGWYKRRATIILAVIALGVAGVFNVDSWQVANTLWTDNAVRAAVVAQAEGASKKTVEEASKDVTGEIALPLGWKPAHKDGDKAPADPRAVPADFGSWVAKLLGLLVTAFALTLGAPFWFEALGRLVKVRNTGPKERAREIARLPEVGGRVL